MPSSSTEHSNSNKERFHVFPGNDNRKLQISECSWNYWLQKEEIYPAHQTGKNSTESSPKIRHVSKLVFVIISLIYYSNYSKKTTLKNCLKELIFPTFFPGMKGWVVVIWSVKGFLLYHSGTFNSFLKRNDFVL